MTVQSILKKLKALSDEKRRAHNTKYGAGENQFGVAMGNIRKVAKEIKINHELALELWETENIDARFYAILCMKPKSLSPKELDRLVRSETFVHVADWLTTYVVKKHPDKEALRVKWMKAKHPMALRAGWNLTAERVVKDSAELDLKALLGRVESEMGDAVPEAQWTMNFVLVEIGVHHAKHRKRALAIGEKLGVFSDFPTSKGCTSPFAPIWINEMVSRQS